MFIGLVHGDVTLTISFAMRRVARLRQLHFCQSLGLWYNVLFNEWCQHITRLSISIWFLWFFTLIWFFSFKYSYSLIFWHTCFLGVGRPTYLKGCKVILHCWNNYMFASAFIANSFDFAIQPPHCEFVVHRQMIATTTPPSLTMCSSICNECCKLMGPPQHQFLAIGLNGSIASQL